MSRKMFGYIRGYAPLNDVLGAENVLAMNGVSVEPNQLNQIDLLVLFGGEDISPHFYGEKPVATGAPEIPSHRDAVEREYFKACIDLGIPVLAICRGAQLACCLLGGKLWQDVDRHEACDHDVIVDGKVYKTNSYHHQMMRPTDEMEVIGYTPCRSRVKTAMKPVVDEGDEPEIVYHRKHRVLMIQGHPEWVTEDHDLFKLTYQLAKELLLCPKSA